jgi:hypothetical protein
MAQSQIAEMQSQIAEMQSQIAELHSSMAAQNYLIARLAAPTPPALLGSPMSIASTPEGPPQSMATTQPAFVLGPTINQLRETPQMPSTPVWRGGSAETPQLPSTPAVATASMAQQLEGLLRRVADLERSRRYPPN